jgi:preprotein translocase subunit SecF
MLTTRSCLSLNPTEVRGVLADAGITDAVVQYFGTSRDIMIRLPVDATRASADQSSEVITILRDARNETLTDSPEGGIQRCLISGSVGDCHVQMRRVEFVGPQVGDELTEKGGLAMLYALIGILIYVAFRFEWRFAVGSVLALVHDVLITLGVFSVLAFEFSLPVLAAVLAVIGYSLNDTIVVFDRIRDNFRKMRKGLPSEIMNRSINQTLPRTVLTSVTTLLVVLTLLLVGGEIMKGFAIALLIGIVIGTYSSIFVASPSVLMLGISREDMLPVVKEAVEGDSAP